MKRLLVIGSSGLLGSKLMELGKEDYEMWGTYNVHMPKKASNILKLDATDRTAVFKLMEKVKPDCVIDTHSLTNLDYCETHTDEAWRVNVEGTRYIAGACKQLGSKLVFISTDDVFDGAKLKYTEKDKPHPLNYYAKTKLVAEYMLSALDMNHIIVRTSVLYGAGGSSKVSFAIWLIAKLKNNEHVRIVADQKNNPTLTDNLAEFLFRLYEKDETKIFHITGKDCVSRYDFANEIAKHFDLDSHLIIPVTSPELNQIAPRPGRVNMVTEKAERVTNLKTITIKEGLLLLKKQISNNL